MGRPAGPPARRIELTQIKEGSPLLHELETEATGRGISLAEHVYDLLMARYLARRGDDYAALMWIPQTSIVTVASTPSDDGAAAAAASAWLALLEEES